MCVCNCMVVKASAQYVLKYYIDRQTCGLIYSYMHSVPIQLFQIQEDFFITMTVSMEAHPQEKFHVKIRPGVSTNLLFPGLYQERLLTFICIRSITACGFPEGRFIPHGPRPGWLQANHNRLVSSQSPSHKKAASLSMKQFQPLKCKPLASHCHCT